MKKYTGIVRDVDISHMVAAVEFRHDGQKLPWEVKVGRIYDLGEKITVFDISKSPKPWYLQGYTFVDSRPISEAEVMRGN